MGEDEMVGWYHRFNGHESEQTLGDSEGQGSLPCCSLYGYRESDTEWLNNCAKHLTCIFPRQTSEVGLYFTEDKEG